MALALNAAKAKASVDDDRQGTFTLEGGTTLTLERSGKINPETGKRMYAWKTTDENAAELAALLNSADVSVRANNSEEAVSDVTVTLTDEEGERVFLNEEEGAEDPWAVGAVLRPQADRA